MQQRSVLTATCNSWQVLAAMSSVRIEDLKNTWKYLTTQVIFKRIQILHITVLPVLTGPVSAELREALAANLTWDSQITDDHSVSSCKCYTKLFEKCLKLLLKPAIQETSVRHIGVLALELKVIRTLRPWKSKDKCQRQRHWPPSASFGLHAKQLVMVVAMHFNHFAIHHAFPAKLHSAFRITCTTARHYRNNTEKWKNINTTQFSTRELQPDIVCIVCIDQVAAENVIAVILIVLQGNKGTTTLRKKTCHGVATVSLITGW